MNKLAPKIVIKTFWCKAEEITQKLDREMNIHLPADFASELGLEPESEVSVTMTGDSVMVRPAGKTYLLDTLLEQVSEDNRHGETPTGEPLAKEER